MKKHPFNPRLDRQKFLKLGLAGAAVTAIGTGHISKLAASLTPSSPEHVTPVRDIDIEAKMARARHLFV